jgi:hypothetical protein
MPTNLQGNPNNITTPLVRTVAGTSSGSGGRVRIQTTVPHFYATNDVVVIYGIVGTTEANGRFFITVIDATHFDLQSAFFVHAWVSGGTVADLSLLPYVQVPNDGEPGIVEVYNAAIQNLLDRTAFLQSFGQQAVGQIVVAPTPYNISNAAHWVVGIDWTGSSIGPYMRKDTVTDDTAIIVELTPYLLAQTNRTLHRITTLFNVGQSHPNVPAILPTLFVFRGVSFNTVVGTALTPDVQLRGAGAVPFPTPGSGAAYYASGNVQSWDYITDQNNIIDTSEYRYYLGIIDESGANSLGLNKYIGFTLGLI